MFSMIRETIESIYAYGSPTSSETTTAIQYTEPETEAITSPESPEIKAAPEGTLYPEVEISPKVKKSPEVKKSEIEVSVSSTVTGTQPIYKLTTLLFFLLWIFTMVLLVVGVVIYYQQTAILQFEMDALRINITYLRELVKVKVAFAASLKNQTQVTLGPYKEFHILVYENVFTNIGNAYNEMTGVFTAPVKGVYQFSFTAFGWSTNIPTSAELYKNGVYITGAYDNNPGPGRGTALSVALQLEEGDIVYLGLAKGMRVHDNTNHYNVFSGHLLFPLIDHNL